MYDAQLGRWHTTDPLEQYVSPYVYVDNNPVGMNDPSGMWAESSNYITKTVVDPGGRIIYHDPYDPDKNIYQSPDGQQGSDGNTDGLEVIGREKPYVNYMEGYRLHISNWKDGSTTHHITPDDGPLSNVSPEYEIIEFIYTGGGLLLIRYGGKWIIKKTSKKLLIKQLVKQGTKHTADDILSIGKNAAGKIIFLEKGSAKAGLTHILKAHSDDFVKNGIADGDIADLVFKAATQGKAVGVQGTRTVFEVTFNGTKKRVAVQVSNNGFIVGANPVSIR